MRGRATKFVPTPCVEDEERAVGIFQHIRGMEISAVANQEIDVATLERGAGRFEDVALDLVQVELAGEQIAFVIGAKNR